MNCTTQSISNRKTINTIYIDAANDLITDYIQSQNLISEHLTKDFYTFQTHVFVCLENILQEFIGNEQKYELFKIPHFNHFLPQRGSIQENKLNKLFKYSVIPLLKRDWTKFEQDFSLIFLHKWLQMQIDKKDITLDNKQNYYMQYKYIFINSIKFIISRPLTTNEENIAENYWSLYTQSASPTWLPSKSSENSDYCTQCYLEISTSRMTPSQSECCLFNLEYRNFSCHDETVQDQTPLNYILDRTLDTLFNHAIYQLYCDYSPNTQSYRKYTQELLRNLPPFVFKDGETIDSASESIAKSFSNIASKYDITSRFYYNKALNSYFPEQKNLNFKKSNFSPLQEDKKYLDFLFLAYGKSTNSGYKNQILGAIKQKADNYILEKLTPNYKAHDLQTFKEACLSYLNLLHNHSASSNFQCTPNFIESINNAVQYLLSNNTDETFNIINSYYNPLVYEWHYYSKILDLYNSKDHDMLNLLVALKEIPYVETRIKLLDTYDVFLNKYKSDSGWIKEIAAQLHIIEIIIVQIIIRFLNLSETISSDSKPEQFKTLKELFKFADTFFIPESISIQKSKAGKLSKIIQAEITFFNPPEN